MQDKQQGPVCAFCDSRRLDLIMDFGRMALAGGFLKPQQFPSERTFPMRLHFCRDCFAVQITDKVSPDVLFENYFYFSSSIGTLRDHFRSYAQDVTRRFLVPSEAKVLEFGCNDGVLLRPLADLGVKTVIGVDPAMNVLGTIQDPRLTLINGYFTTSVAQTIVSKHGQLDLIMANNVFAHIAEIQDTTEAVARALSPDGVFAFEVHYLGKVIDELQYDMIYHEHLYYYSLVSLLNHLDRHDMTIFDLLPIPIHAGSIRFYACKKGSRHSKSVTSAVASLLAEERSKGFDRFDRFERFSKDVADHRHKMLTLLETLRRKGKRIVGYGASGRANTMIQYCDINHDHIEFVIDDAPAKIGMYTPNSHFQIKSSAVLAGPDTPDYVLVFAWSFLAEIKARLTGFLERGGQMIVPFPEPSIVVPAKLA